MMRSLSKRGWIRVVSYIAAAMLVLVGYCISIYQSNLAYRRTITNSYLRAFPRWWPALTGSTPPCRKNSMW